MDRMEQWQADYSKAEAAWSVSAYGDGQTEGIPIVVVEAEAQTGSKYVVVVTPLPLGWQGSLGGDVLVSVLQPWQTAGVYSAGTSDVTGTFREMHVSYVAEKFLRPGAAWSLVHGGDVAAITKTINAAMARAHVANGGHLD